MTARRVLPSLEQVLGSATTLDTSRLEGDGPGGRLPLTPEMLRSEPSGHIFGLTQNAGMGWHPGALDGPQYVIVSTMGGVRSEQGEPIALGYHTGHWEIGLLVRGAAEALRAGRVTPPGTITPGNEPVPANASIVAGSPLSQVAIPSTPAAVGSDRISRRITIAASLR